MKPKLVFTYCLFVASAICLLAAAQSTKTKSSAARHWPKPDQSDSDHLAAVIDAVDSFTATLTRAGYDRDFRQRLTDSCDAAKNAVSEEGKIDIPSDVVIMFYEPGTYGQHFGFMLPPLNEQAHIPYKYTDDDYYECCLPRFSKLLVTRRDPSLAAALDAAMTRAGYDSHFRDRLTASCDSAKNAVSEEGRIDIRKDAQMIFHSKIGDERYHIFELPPFDPNSRKEHLYSDSFQGLYPLWVPHTPTSAPAR